MLWFVLAYSGFWQFMFVWFQVSLINVVMELRKLCCHGFMTDEPDTEPESPEEGLRFVCWSLLFYFPSFISAFFFFVWPILHLFCTLDSSDFASWALLLFFYVIMCLHNRTPASVCVLGVMNIPTSKLWPYVAVLHLLSECRHCLLILSSHLHENTYATGVFNSGWVFGFTRNFGSGYSGFTKFRFSVLTPEILPK
jgi:hypothetical protein